ncbi:limbic system-associated membrane protein-like [Nematostella vectensis]|uniref:limbic system-associated membrane protein-like n=1 Tax=Nematostella vectensis TaxID=45351 RepID=UPI00207770A4|nr:limbic system-associated membrane protein-like [Nematostella vectensis]
MAIDLLAQHQVPSDQRVIIRPSSHSSSCYCRMLLIKLSVLSLVLLLLPHQGVSLDIYAGDDARFTWTTSSSCLAWRFGISNHNKDDFVSNGKLMEWFQGVSKVLSRPNDTDTTYKGRLYFYGDYTSCSGVFEIRNVSVADEKWYLVMITKSPSVPNGVPSASWDLNVKVAPTFTSSLSSSRDVAENDDVAVTCSASGRPAPNVTWVNKTSGSPVAHGTGSATLSLLKIQRHQAEVYQCQAINDVRRGAITQDITINVQYPPEITPMQNTTVRAGETITLTCAVAGNPTPSVFWSKAGSGHSTGGNVFTKAGATKADTGQYVCTAVNTVTGNTQTRTASTYVMVKCKCSMMSNVSAL